MTDRTVERLAALLMKWEHAERERRHVGCFSFDDAEAADIAVHLFSEGVTLADAGSPEPMTGTLTHGANRDCPDVQSGRWTRCMGHAIGASAPRVPSERAIDEIHRAAQEAYNLRSITRFQVEQLLGRYLLLDFPARGPQEQP